MAEVDFGPFPATWNDVAQVGYIQVVPEIRDGEAVRQEFLGKTVIADYNANDELLGIEFLGAWATNLEDDPAPEVSP